MPKTTTETMMVSSFPSSINSYPRTLSKQADSGVTSLEEMTAVAMMISLLLQVLEDEPSKTNRLRIKTADTDCLASPITAPQYGFLGSGIGFAASHQAPVKVAANPKPVKKQK